MNTAKKDSHRSRAVIAAGSPEAAEAGAAVLEEGGNAFDAAVAISLSLGVTEPAGSGIGGQGILIVHPPEGDPFVIQGSSFSPSRTQPDATLPELVEHRATTVPSLLRVLDFMWRTYGSGKIPWHRLVEPAIHHARVGYPLGAFRRRALLRHARAIRSSGVATKLLLAPDGSVPEQGAVLRNPILGDTLERIAFHGTEDFYRGEIAREIVSDMERHDGLITREDLEQVPEPPVVPALRGSYRGWDVFSVLPPASGWVLLLALNVLEQAPEGEVAVDGPARLVWMTESLFHAHRVRVYRPIPNLANYGDAIASRTSKERAIRIVRSLVRFDHGETTHFSILDRDGTAIGMTQSLNSYYGAKAASPKLGFLYNDYMHEFVVGLVNHPFALRPKAPPYSSMSATILARGRKPELVLGSPGDERIISAVVQVASHWADIGAGIEAAVAAPRIHVLRDVEVMLERKPEATTSLLALERRGYVLYQPLSSLFAGELNPYFGGVHAAAREDGELRGAADPRRDGAVAYVGE